MRTSELRHRRTAFLTCTVLFLLLLSGYATAARAADQTKQPCYQAVVEGDVKAGEGFDVVFAKGLRFYLEPLASGWIVRVLAAEEPRGPHDYAGIASPPYNSVSPLLISTDWSFRAQDAVGWNPRRFHFAANKEAFSALSMLYSGALANDAGAMGKVASLVSQQPDGVLEILDARFVPGIADQSRMAAMVAAHLSETPHTVEQSATASPLGKLLQLHFRVSFDLPAGMHAAQGVKEVPAVCPARPTTVLDTASQQKRVPHP